MVFVFNEISTKKEVKDLCWFHFVFSSSRELIYECCFAYHFKLLSALKVIYSFFVTRRPVIGVFAGSTLAILRTNFMTQRKRIAFKLKNPRLRRITFHTLRHFYGTMEYHKTKDILHVQQKLGHKKISSTLVYTHLVNFESDEYTVRVAKTLREDEELLKAGFEYVTERDGIKVYRKRK